MRETGGRLKCRVVASLCTWCPARSLLWDNRDLVCGCGSSFYFGAGRMS
jgi:hypothetical protein